MMEELDRLLEADCDEEANGYRCDVDEEIFPGVDDLVGSVDVKHGHTFLTGWRLVESARGGFGGGRSEIRGARVVGRWGLRCRAGIAVVYHLILLVIPCR